MPNTRCIGRLTASVSLFDKPALRARSFGPFGSGLAGAATRDAEVAMGSERNNMVVREFIEAINRQDWSQLDVVVVAGVVRHSSTSAQPQVRSRDDLKGSRWREATIFPDAHEHNHFFVAEGNKVSARLAFRGTQRGPMGPFSASGKMVMMDFLCIFRLGEERIVEIWVEWDNLSALMQLGHYTPPCVTSRWSRPGWPCRSVQQGRRSRRPRQGHFCRGKGVL